MRFVLEMAFVIACYALACAMVVSLVMVAARRQERLEAERRARRLIERERLRRYLFGYSGVFPCSNGRP